MDVGCDLLLNATETTDGEIFTCWDPNMSQLKIINVCNPNEKI